MLRRSGAAVAVLALLAGLSAAPYTHAHHAIASVSDEHHPKGATLVHTHAAPHAHQAADHSLPGPAGHEERDEQIWSVDGFVFEQTVPDPAPSPGLLAVGEPPIVLTIVGPGAERPHPTAHGPPIGSPSGLRAPPDSLPTFA